MSGGALERLRAHRAEVVAIAARHRARDVRLIGSHARGTARPDSDLDLLVSFEPGWTRDDFRALWLDLRRLLGVELDVFPEEGLAPEWRAKVRAEARPLDEV